jgi:hypothetical protein
MSTAKTEDAQNLPGKAKVALFPLKKSTICVPIAPEFLH